MFKRLFFVSIILWNFSCTREKSRDYYLDGYVHEKETNAKLSGVRIFLVKQYCCGGCNWRLIDSTRTNGNGHYEFNFVWEDNWSMYSDSYVSPYYKVIARNFGETEGDDGSKDLSNSNRNQHINFNLEKVKYARVRVVNKELKNYFSKFKISYRNERNLWGYHCNVDESDTIIYNLKTSLDTTLIVPTGYVSYALGGENPLYDVWDYFSISKCENQDTCFSLLEY